MSKNGKVWFSATGTSRTERKTRVTRPVSIQPAQFGNQRISCVLLTKNKERVEQYAGIIENDKNEICVVSDFGSDCQPEKSGWYLCLTPKRKQRSLFVSGGKPVFTVKVVSVAITAWKSSINSRTIAGYFSPSPNDLFEKEDAVLFFGEDNDYFVWVKDPKKRIDVLQELNRREEEIMYHKNPWVKKYGLIFSPHKIVGSSLDKREVIEIVFG